MIFKRLLGSIWDDPFPLVPLDEKVKADLSAFDKLVKDAERKRNELSEPQEPEADQ